MGVRNENGAENRRSAIIERIKKLFALAGNNPNENEALSAALKAQKLVADYDVTQEELHADDGSRKVVDEHSDGDVWSAFLAQAVGDNFRCKTWCVPKHVGSRRVVYESHFLGYACDAAAAKTTYESLHRVAERLVKAAVRDSNRLYGTSKGVRKSFLIGFARGVRTELEKQSQALMLVCPSKVKAVYDEKFSDGMKTSHYSCGRNRRAYVSGSSAGRDAVRSGRIEGQLALA